MGRAAAGRIGWGKGFQPAREMRVTLDKTGAPGNLYFGIQLLYRFIIT